MHISGVTSDVVHQSKSVQNGRSRSGKAGGSDTAGGCPEMRARGTIWRDPRFSSSRRSGKVAFDPQDTLESFLLTACWPLAPHENKSLTGGNSEQVYGVYVQ